MDIVTGHVGSAHVTSWQDRDLNQGIFGPDTYILNVGSKLAATIISNNEIRIADGTLVMQGCQGVIQKGTYDTISIDNGTQGLKRNDLICAQYQKSAGVESMSLVVIKGTAAATPSDPAYTSGDIQNGDTPVQVPIYRVSLNGLTLESVTALVDIQDSVSDISADLIPVISSVNVIGDTYEAHANSVPVPNGDTEKTVVDLTLPAGTYIVVCDAFFSSGNPGDREIRLYGPYIGSFRSVLDVYKRSNSSTAYGQLSAIFSDVSSFTVELDARQWVTSSLNVSGSITAVRIK